MAVVWTVHVPDPLVGFTVFLAALVYYCPGIFSLCQIGHNLYKADNDDKENKKNDTLFKCFVWITSYFLYILLYSFFPAFVLAFAYPTRVITVFVFIATFMILSVVYLTTYMNKGLKVCDKEDDNQKLKPVVWCVMSLFLIYFFLFVFALLYSLVIGKASVVSSAPLAILSLLPSIIISIAAWLLKSTMLENNNNTEDENVESKDATHNKYNAEPKHSSGNHERMELEQSKETVATSDTERV